MAIGISFLLVVPAALVRPTSATAVTGLYGAYWKGTWFGSPAPPYPGCPSATYPVPSPPAGTPSSTPPTVTEIDPTIYFGGATGWHWDESNSTATPGYPGGFAVTQGGYGVAAASWGDPSLYSDYPTSTYFVNTEFSVEWTGYITLTAGTTYYFTLESDDGSALYINNMSGSSAISNANLVLSSWVKQGPTAFSGTFIPLGTTGTAHQYAIEIDYFETCDTQSGIEFDWLNALGLLVMVPTDVLTPAAIGSNAPPIIKTVPQFGLAVPVVAAFSLLAFAIVRKRTLATRQPDINQKRTQTRE
jgi:hypothetical protein